MHNGCYERSIRVEHPDLETGRLTCRMQKTTPLNTPKTKISRTKGKSSHRTKFVREIAREVVGLAPYERRVIELLRNAQDKRARKLAKKRLGTFGRGKRKSVSSYIPINNKYINDQIGLRTCRVLSPRPAVFRVTKRSNNWTLSISFNDSNTWRIRMKKQILPRPFVPHAG